MLIFHPLAKRFSPRSLEEEAEIKGQCNHKKIKNLYVLKEELEKVRIN